MIGDGDDSDVRTAPVLAYIFLFPSQVKVKTDLSKNKEESAKNVFFLEQIDNLQDACGTIATIHAIAQNKQKVGLADGILKEFLNQVEHLSVRERGEALCNNAKLRTLHCSAVSDARASTKQVSVGSTDNHFVCFTTAQCGSDTYIVELDGRKPFPLFHQKQVDGLDFASAAGALIRTLYMTDPSVNQFSTIALADLSL
eukprot:TRINITY_DN1350_c0_g1_i1.p1 TRINITY_DN1350_c0_g1~~TRINITY_DN1350_c0_g1_i1.p1  ORF type:complete len:229 (-),score=49.08 TRINITY_DN1350_c0_g1_i1:61-657(-)